MVDVWPEQVSEILARRGWRGRDGGLSEWALWTERCGRYRDIRGFNGDMAGCLRRFDS